MSSSLLTELFRPLTLSAAAEIAAALLPPVSPRTCRWWRQSLKGLTAYLGDDRPAIDISRQEIEEWHAYLLRRVSPVTANNNLRAVRIVFNRLIRMGYVSGNPALIPYAPQPPNRPQAISAATYQAMSRVAGVRDRAVLALLWATGARIGELPTLTLRGLDLWIDSERNELQLAAAVVGKYHRRRSITHAGRYLYAAGLEAENVRDWLNARPHCPTDALFPSRDRNGPIALSTLHSALRKLRIDAGLSPDAIANAHAFRHAFAYRKRREGYPLEWISEWLGHADPAFTARMYGDKSEPEIRRRFFAPPPGG